jgi:[calcium/calmodulin-dependent protein kinase] kinase
MLMNEDEEEDEEGLLVDTAGTYTFLAPECCTGEAFSPWPVDVWAAGVTLYVFLFGRLPFQKEGGLGPLFEAIQEEVVEFPPRAEEEEGEGEGGREVMVLEEEVRDILEGLFRKKPEERWTLKRLREHAWLEKAQREDEEEDRRREEEEAARREKEEEEVEGRE